MNKNERDLNKQDPARHADPITGAPGMHPVGTGLGAVAGGAAAGAAVGTVAGPAGTIAGAAVGAIIGGLAGKGIAEAVNPTAEAAYWKDSHRLQPYSKGRAYDDYRPAYASGYEGYGKYGTKGSTFSQAEPSLRKDYESGRPSLSWDEAKPASEAAWKRVHDQQSKTKRDSV